MTKDPPQPGAPGVTDAVDRGGSDRALVRRFRLIVTEGQDVGRSCASTAAKMVVGTHESCDFVLHDKTVSRFQCEITIVEGRALVKDLDSKNGTVLDGTSVLHAFLQAGSILHVGNTKLRFDLGTDHLSVPVSEQPSFGRLTGASVPMRSAFAMLERAAGTDATVLLEGETGTGKEAAAESLHAASARKDAPFVVIDCASIPPELLESELFGHEKGAFTGAVAAREGAFEAAHGGTIFLDEIGELGSDLQPKLLRALERHEIKRVGSNKYQPVDVRVVAATNRNLRGEVNSKRFRADLYYRLAVVEVRLPPLRERVTDLPMLVDHLLAQLGVTGADAERLRSEAFLTELARHPWPGNVRELRNYLERCLTLRDAAGHLGEATGTEDAEVLKTSLPLKEARERWNRILERRYAQALLERHGDNVRAAAREAGVDRPYFYRILWRHGLK